MAANTLSAEVAGRCFWGLVLNGPPAREKEGWPVSQTRSQASMDGGSGTTCPSLETSLRLLWAGGEQVQEGPCWRDQLCLSLGPGCPLPHLLCSWAVEVSLLWASGFRRAQPHPLCPRELGIMTSYYFPGTCWVSGTVLRGLYQSGKNNKGTNNSNLNSKSYFLRAYEGWALILLITPQAGRCYLHFTVSKLRFGEVRSAC